jgi:hypothetical protein
MLSTTAILLGLLVVAGLVAAAASRYGVSPWWAFVPAAVAGGIALATSSDVASCESAHSTEALFGFGVLLAVGLFATAAFTALFDAIRLARLGAKGRAAARLIPLLASLALGFGTLVLWVVTLVSCLA